MRKTTIQAIIDGFLIIAFIIFVYLYSRIDNPITSVRSVWVSAFLMVVSAICLSKFILYRRQNFLYFFGVFFVDFLVVLINIYNFDYLISRGFGVFALIPGVMSILFYLRYREAYQIRFGVFLCVVGVALLILFK